MSFSKKNVKMSQVNRRFFLKCILLVPTVSFTERLACARGFQSLRSRVSTTYIDVDTPIDKVRKIVALGGVIKFNVGVFNIGRITIPSNCSIIGSGQLVYNEAVGKWSGQGTLILGSINCNDASDFIIKDITIDSFDMKLNSLYSVTPKTGPGHISHVTTRANNHGQLWESNDDNPENSNSIGSILIEECIHYHGPNGFVTKQKNVTFKECKVINIEVQAFVIASDNINGPSRFSRAINSKILNCSVFQTIENGSQGVRIYSREYFLNREVLGVDNALVVGFSAKGLGANGIKIGDGNPNEKYKKIISDNISILLTDKIQSKYSEIKISDCDLVMIAIKNSNIEPRIEFNKNFSRVYVQDSNVRIEECTLYKASNNLLVKLKKIPE